MGSDRYRYTWTIIASISGWLLCSMANGSQYVAASHLSNDRVRAYMHICYCETACCRPHQQKTKFGSSQAKNRWLRLKYFSAGVDKEGRLSIHLVRSVANGSQYVASYFVTLRHRLLFMSQDHANALTVTSMPWSLFFFVAYFLPSFPFEI